MKYGVCLEMIFTDRPFPERIQLAAEAGFTFAEIRFTGLTAGARGKDAKDLKVAAQS